MTSKGKGEKEGDVANYYIADLHLGHENVIRFDNRPFADLEEMHRTIIDNWNRTVTAGDTVYIGAKPINDDEDHFLFASYEVTSGSVSNWTSGSFTMGDEPVELTFTFVRVRTLTILNAEGGSCNVLTSPFVTMDGQDYYKDGAKVEIEAVPDSTHKLSKFIVNSDDAEDNPLSIFMVSDMTVPSNFSGGGGKS